MKAWQWHSMTEQSWLCWLMKQICSTLKGMVMKTTTRSPATPPPSARKWSCSTTSAATWLSTWCVLAAAVSRRRPTQWLACLTCATGSDPETALSCSSPTELCRLVFTNFFFVYCGILTGYFSLQINFSNHNKLIICPLMEAVTHITSDNVPHTYRFSSIESQGCSDVLHKGLETALVKVKAMINTTQPSNCPAWIPCSCTN